MSDLDILREMIKDDVLVPVQVGNYGKRELVLKEGSGQHIYEIKIHKIPDNIIAFKADKFPPPKAVFKNHKKECKRADFIVVANSDKENWIIYIEMKAGGTDLACDIKLQLKGAECLLAYCRAIGRTFWLEQDFLKENDYEQRFVSIKNARVNKRPTRILPKSGVHDKPEKMLKLNSPNRNMLEFNQIVNG